MNTQEFLEHLARMKTDEEMNGEMESDDAVETVNFAIRTARELLANRPQQTALV
jgi:hypothetical protein